MACKLTGWWGKEEPKVSIQEEVKKAVSQIEQKYVDEGIKNRKEIVELKAALKERTADLAKITAQARAQNEADLFLACERIKQRILDGESRANLRTEIKVINNLQGIEARIDALQMNQALGNFAGGAFQPHPLFRS
jgi:hypothetical protein